MKTILSLVVASFLIVTGADAKAGSSGGTSRSSGSFTKSSSSYGTTSKGSATKQTSFTGSSSSSTPVTNSTTSTRPTTPAATTVPSSPTSSAHSQPVTTSNSSNTHTIIERDSGPGLGTTILGTMAGAAAGTMIGNAISSPSHNSGAVTQPVVVQTPSQPMAQAPSSSTSYQPQATATTSNSSSSFSFLGFLYYVLLFAGGFYLGRKLFHYWKGRKAMFNPLEAESHVPVLTQIYILVQLAAGHLDGTAKQVLANNCTNDMYRWLTNTVSENKERGCVNVITDVEPIDTTIRSCEQIDGKLYISLKVTAQMRDYWTDLRGGILDGSSTDLITTTDVFTFVSTNGGKKWLLSAIEEYETKSME